MSRRKWLCLDCKVDTGKIAEHYMLKDSVWSKVHGSKVGMLCVGCVEKRLGRFLNKNDFFSCHVNRTSHCKSFSQRLLNAMEYEPSTWPHET